MKASGTFGRRRFPLAVVLVGAVWLSAGCTPWPAGGSGGLAERHLLLSDSTRSVALEIEALAAQGARRRFPAAMREAEELLVAAHRAENAGLHAEAQEDLHRAEQILRRVRR